MKYSLQNLAARTKLPFEACLEVVVASNTPRELVSGDALIDEADLGAFLTALEAKKPSRFYTLPTLLREPGSDRWRGRLAEIYAGKNAFPAVMSPEQGQLLRSVVLNVAPEVVVEIGTFLGVSALWMASALAEIGRGEIHCVDFFEPILPFPSSNCIYIKDPMAYIQQNFAASGLDVSVFFHKGNSRQTGTHYDRKIGKAIDFLLIDGDHTVPGAWNDFVLYEPHVKPGGYILLHDIYPVSGWDGPRYILDNIAKYNPGYSVLEFATRPVNFGIALLRKPV